MRLRLFKVLVLRLLTLRQLCFMHLSKESHNSNVAIKYVLQYLVCSVPKVIVLDNTIVSICFASILNLSPSLHRHRI